MKKRAKSEARVIPFTTTRIVSGGEPEEPHVADPPKPLTEKEALDVLWTAKNMFKTDEEGLPVLDPETKKPIPNPKWCDAFVYATLCRDVTVEVEGKPKKPRVIKKGTRVLVTMVSRFGDVGVRDDRLVPASNGYCARVKPDDLTDWNMAP